MESDHIKFGIVQRIYQAFCPLKRQTLTLFSINQFLLVILHLISPQTNFSAVKLHDFSFFLSPASSQAALVRE